MSRDRWPDRLEGRLADAERRPWWTALKWTLGVLSIVAIVMVAGGFFGWWFGWGAKVAEVTGAENTDTQYTALYEDINRMEAAAANYCQVKNSEPNAQAPSLVEDPEVAYAATYRSIQADYDRRFANFFEAGGLLIKPGDLPRVAPSLQQMAQRVC